MGGGHGEGGGGGGDEREGRGHQQELCLWPCHPLHPQHTYDLLVAHKSVSEAASSSSDTGGYNLQCCCYGQTWSRVQHLHPNTRIFHFCHFGETLRDQPSSI